MTQWVPLYESSEETVKSEVATFCQVFPNATCGPMMAIKAHTM